MHERSSYDYTDPFIPGYNIPLLDIITLLPYGEVGYYNFARGSSINILKNKKGYYVQ